MNVAKAIAVTAAALAGSLCAAAEPMIDISGTYSEHGMTIRATAGAPSAYVSMCGLLSLDLNEANHKMLAPYGRRVTITQYGDLAVEFLTHAGQRPDGSRTGTCHGTWTKADGVQVDKEALVLPRRPSKVSKGRWRAVYRFTLDEERRLIVFAEFIFTGTRPQRMSAVYAFPRSGEAAAKERK